MLTQLHTKGNVLHCTSRPNTEIWKLSNTWCGWALTLMQLVQVDGVYFIMPHIGATTKLWNIYLNTALNTTLYTIRMEAWQFIRLPKWDVPAAGTYLCTMGPILT